jgi:peroxiredoxin family protein
MTQETMQPKCSIVVFSGDMDRVMGAFIIATSAAASGMDTSMFFSFWGLKAIQKGNRTGAGLFGRLLGLLNRGGIDRIGPSRFNFGGVGRWLFKKMMHDKGVASLPELLQMAIDLDVHLVACSMSMDVMEIRREDLIDDVEDIVGAATFVANARQSAIQLFI